jgi:protein-S-isoprenylcysteine O-methyltransferase Ste14
LNSLWILVLVLPLAIILQKGVIEPEESYLEKKFGDKFALQSQGPALDLAP